MSIRLFVVSLFFSASLSAATLRGIIKDSAGQPLSGVTVAVDTRSVETTADGGFVFELPDGHYTLRISRAGFQGATRSARTGEEVEVELKPAVSESIVVSGIRAEDETPVTKTNVSRAEIAREYHQQDIPTLLRAVPSVTTYTESGVGGSGYSYITMRGMSPTRINFTLDGVPLADSEDMGTYFADFPDLAHSLQSIQVQRGVGTSTVGSPSFGGSVNLESIALAQDTATDARVSAGSYGGRFATVGWQSGFTPGGLALYGRLSWQESDGFREHSGIRQRNLFLSGAKQFDDAQLKITGFSGHEDQQLSFNATDVDTLRTNLRANPLSPDDRDSFGYDLAQVQYLRANMTASVYYQRGYGWYRLYDDESTQTDLRQYGLDGMLLGSLVTFSWNLGPLSANYGVHLNRFRREHTRDLVGGPRDYFNYGVKSEANAFAKLGYDAGRWHLYSDAQLRTTDFRYHGEVQIDPIRWTFFNPKLGARLDLSGASSVYATAGLSTREPTRNDLFQGEDNASFAHDLRAVRPERLLDVELGYDLRMSRFALAANVYAMELRNEIAATGELSDIGLALRRNVDRSYRRGVELDATWQASPALRLRTSASLSRNRIRTWTQFYDVYDDAGNYVTSRPIIHHDVAPLLTPSAILNQSLDYTAGRLSLGGAARWVAKSYLDNTSSKAFITPSFFTLDANAAYDLSRNLRLSLRINNLLNNRRVWASGYSYQYVSGDTLTGIPYYYPQATRNAVVMLDVKL
ncbi:MAG TPA: TonB-dependent receptor [Thermoanaerobaculia bacterium]|nr:TonB-dependent receptor [Thermoanaerobaculia bacterium]